MPAMSSDNFPLIMMGGLNVVPIGPRVGFSEEASGLGQACYFCGMLMLSPARCRISVIANFGS